MSSAKRIFAVFVVLTLVLGACSSDDDSGAEDTSELQSQLDEVTAELEQAQEDLAAAEEQLGSMAPVSVVQAGEVGPPPAGEPAPTGWETEEAIRGGMSLFAQYDSSGDPAWDFAEHPVVYFTSEGVGANPLTADEEMLPGIHVIDAYTKEVVASALYDLGEMTRTPHGAGVSPDGQWAYVGTGVMVDDEPQLLLLVINAKTLKLDKALAYPGRSFVHHHMAYTDPNGDDRVVVTVNRCPQFFLDPNDDNRVVQTITTEDVPLCGHTYPTMDPTNTYFYQSMDQTYYGNDHGIAGIMKINMLEDFLPEAGRGRGNYLSSDMIWGFGFGGRVIGIAHTADGKYSYVVDAHNSEVYKLDNETNEIVGKTSAGVAGPYGACLNWDETELYIVGKGEGSHNHGSVLGIVDTVTFRQSREDHQMPIFLGGSASSVDHCVMHPDPEVNEVWISNMNGWDTIIMDAETHEVTAHIETPNGGDTHGMAFVEYDAEGNGTLLVDLGGPKTDEIWQLRRDAVAALGGE